MDLEFRLQQVQAGLVDAHVGLDPQENHLIPAGGPECRGERLVAPAAEALLHDGRDVRQEFQDFGHRRADLHLLGEDDGNSQRPGSQDEFPAVLQKKLPVVHGAVEVSLDVDGHQDRPVDLQHVLFPPWLM